MWRKIVPTVLLVVVLGAGAFAWMRVGSQQECEKWASTTLKKARMSYGAMQGPAGPFEPYLRAMYGRKSFRIDGTLYVNPGGCSDGLLPANPRPRP